MIEAAELIGIGTAIGTVLGAALLAAKRFLSRSPALTDGETDLKNRIEELRSLVDSQKKSIEDQTDEISELRDIIDALEVQNVESIQTIAKQEARLEIIGEELRGAQKKVSDFQDRLLEQSKRLEDALEEVLRAKGFSRTATRPTRRDGNGEGE